jgi:hypothetical protein
MTETIITPPVSKPRHSDLQGAAVKRLQGMHRLFGEGFEQIAQQPGMSKAVMKQLKRERRTILMKYLEHLRRDSIEAFRRTIQARGESEWSPTSVWGRCRVELAVFRIAVNLILHQAGLVGIRVETFRLSIELAKLQLKALRLAF